MILRFWKLSLTFRKYPINGWAFGLMYFDGGLCFTVGQYEMAFDWGYLITEYSAIRWSND